MKAFIIRAAAVILGIAVGLMAANTVSSFTSTMIRSSPARLLSSSPNVGDTCLNDSAFACYARGTFYDGDAWGGGYVQTQVVGLSATSTAYLNEELWVTTSGNSTSTWVEIGYSDNNPFCPGGLRWFWDYVSNGTQHGVIT